MAKGKSRVQYLGQTGMVQGAYSHEDYDFIYESSTTKSPLYNIGDRVVTPDGRVFRYCLSSGACYTGQGNKFWNAVPATGIDWSVLAEDAALGARSVVVTNQGEVAQTLDGLRGGTINFNPDGGQDVGDLQMRLIVGNTADASAGHDGEVTIYFDAPLTAALTTSSYQFCMPSPYSSIKYASDDDTSVAGIAAVYISASGYYHWEQTYGLCWVTPSLQEGITPYARQLVFTSVGGLHVHDPAATHQMYQQHAGFIVDNNGEHNGSTQIMLQISI